MNFIKEPPIQPEGTRHDHLIHAAKPTNPRDAPSLSAYVLPRLFEPFSRGGSGNYQQGLGLGLYIASQIAKSYGVSLGVTSTAEETCFTFTMPRTGIDGGARFCVILEKTVG